MRRLHVSAGGTNTRLKKYIGENFGELPKHLLTIPTPEGSLLGQIMRDAEAHFDAITVWTGRHNIANFLPLVPRYRSANYSVDQHMTGPLGPIIRSALRRKSRSFGCAGDFYCDFSWEEMESFHDGHTYPITILIAPSTPAPDAAVFNLDTDGRIVSWSRRDSTSNDLVNIGAYIIDPTPEVRRMLENLSNHKEDSFNTAAISQNLIAGYVPRGMGFNVNTSSSYEYLLTHLRR